MKNYLQKKGYRLKVTKDYILAEGDIPICLCAHLDTVGKDLPSEIYYDSVNKVMWSPQLLGADDRAGVYAIIKILEKGYRPHVIFTTDEEIGALGAKTLVKENPTCPLENLKAIFQLDRRGADDCVFYGCDNPDFTKYVESFGFKEDLGSFSDISILAPAWGVAAANLSVGYYNEHSEIEILKTKELEKTIRRVCEILDKAETMLNYAYIERIYPICNNKYHASWDRTRNCIFCGNVVPANSGVIINDKTFGDYLSCCKCYSEYFGDVPPFDLSYDI